MLRKDALMGFKMAAVAMGTEYFFSFLCFFCIPQSSTWLSYRLGLR